MAQFVTDEFTGGTWKVAAARAILAAVVVGGGAALAMWAATDDLKLIAIAGLTPVFGILAARLGIEGTVDTRAAAKLATERLDADVARALDPTDPPI